MPQNNDKNTDSNKGCIILFVILVYIGLFLIGPWHYYGELQHNNEHGIALYDNVNRLIGAKWRDDILMLCLHGRVDGKDENIYVVQYQQEISKKSVRNGLENSEFRNIIKLERNEYDIGCSEFEYDNFAEVKVTKHPSGDYYSRASMYSNLSNLNNGKYLILPKIKYKGINPPFKRHFGVFEKIDNDGRMAWFVLNGVYHKEINADAFDYTWALIKDFVTMPYQWFAMFVYVSGGIG